MWLLCMSCDISAAMSGCCGYVVGFAEIVVEVVKLDGLAGSWSTFLRTLSKVRDAPPADRRRCRIPNRDACAPFVREHVPVSNGAIEMPSSPSGALTPASSAKVGNMSQCAECARLRTRRDRAGPPCDEGQRMPPSYISNLMPRSGPFRQRTADQHHQRSGAVVAGENEPAVSLAMPSSFNKSRNAAHITIQTTHSCRKSSVRHWLMAI